MLPTNRLLICMTALAAFHCACAHGGESKPAELDLRWSLSLDASGKITSMTPLFGDDTRTIAGQLEPLIRHWHFIPGSIDGHPVDTQTTLTVETSLDAAGPDNYRVHVVSATTGARYHDGPVPKYPKSAMRMGRYGVVHVQVKHDAGGHVLSATAMRPGDPHVDYALTRAALDAVKQWTFQPETVGGQGVAGSVIVPICFSLEGREAPCVWTTPRGYTQRVDNASAFPTTSVVSVNIDGGAGHDP